MVGNWLGGQVIGGAEDWLVECLIDEVPVLCNRCGSGWMGRLLINY